MGNEIDIFFSIIFTTKSFFKNSYLIQFSNFLFKNVLVDNFLEF